MGCTMAFVPSLEPEGVLPIRLNDVYYYFGQPEKRVSYVTGQRYTDIACGFSSKEGWWEAMIPAEEVATHNFCFRWVVARCNLHH